MVVVHVVVSPTRKLPNLQLCRLVAVAKRIALGGTGQVERGGTSCPVSLRRQVIVRRAENTLHTDRDRCVLARYEQDAVSSRRADLLVVRCRDDPLLLVTGASFEWQEGYTNMSEEEKNIEWFERLSFQDVTKLRGDLLVYISLGMMLGQRSTQDCACGSKWLLLQHGGARQRRATRARGEDVLLTYRARAPTPRTSRRPSYSRRSPRSSSTRNGPCKHYALESTRLH